MVVVVAAVMQIVATAALLTMKIAMPPAAAKAVKATARPSTSAASLAVVVARESKAALALALALLTRALAVAEPRKPLRGAARLMLRNVARAAVCAVLTQKQQQQQQQQRRRELRGCQNMELLSTEERRSLQHIRQTLRPFQVAQTASEKKQHINTCLPLLHIGKLRKYLEGSSLSDDDVIAGAANTLLTD
jgi:hypothetical protein